MIGYYVAKFSKCETDDCSSTIARDRCRCNNLKSCTLAREVFSVKHRVCGWHIQTTPLLLLELRNTRMMEGGSILFRSNVVFLPRFRSDTSLHAVVLHFFPCHVDGRCTLNPLPIRSNPREAIPDPAKYSVHRLFATLPQALVASCPSHHASWMPLLRATDPIGTTFASVNFVRVNVQVQSRRSTTMVTQVAIRFDDEAHATAPPCALRRPPRVFSDHVQPVGDAEHACERSEAKKGSCSGLRRTPDRLENLLWTRHFRCSTLV